MKKQSLIILSTVILVVILSLTLFSCGQSSTYKATDIKGREITAKVNANGTKVDFTYYGEFIKPTSNNEVDIKKDAKFQVTSAITTDLKIISFKVDQVNYTVTKNKEEYVVEKNGEPVNEIIKTQAILVFKLCENIKLSEDKKELFAGGNIYILEERK